MGMPGKTLRRWILLCLALASVWPGCLAFLDFAMDDRSAYEDDNELTALGLIFSLAPLALFVAALAVRRESPVLAALMMPVTLAALAITTLPAYVDAYTLGLGASSKADVAYLEWDKIGIWTGMLFVGCFLVISLDAVVSFVLRARGEARCRKSKTDAATG